MSQQLERLSCKRGCGSSSPLVVHICKPSELIWSSSSHQNTSKQKIVLVTACLESINPICRKGWFWKMMALAPQSFISLVKILICFITQAICCNFKKCTIFKWIQWHFQNTPLLSTDYILFSVLLTIIEFISLLKMHKHTIILPS